MNVVLNSRVKKQMFIKYFYKVTEKSFSLTEHPYTNLSSIFDYKI